MITCKETEYLNYGKCLSITNGAMEVFVTVDLGPRIIKCNVAGRDNLMLTDVDRKMSQDVSDAFGPGKTWYIYGGHLMCVSPENLPLSYYPDNDKVLYSITPSGAVFSPGTQMVNGMRHELEIRMDDIEASMDVVHRLTNENDKVVTGAIWALSVMDADGVEVIPQPDTDTGLLGNRVLALWPYTDMSDKRVFWGEKYISLRQDRSVDKKFKLGINNTRGWIAYVNHGQALVKSYKSAHPDGRYPDFGVSTEVFTNAQFLEAETLSELCDLTPGETISHTETWTLYDGVTKPSADNKSLEEFAARF